MARGVAEDRADDLQESCARLAFLHLDDHVVDLSHVRHDRDDLEHQETIKIAPINWRF